MVSSEAWCESMSRAEWPDFTQVKCTTVFNCFYESFVNKEINTTHFPLTWNWSSHLPHGNNQNYRQLISTQSTLTQAEEGGLISCRPGTIISPQSDCHLKNTTYVDVHHGWMWITERRLKMWAATAGERTSMEKVDLYRVLGTEGARHAAQVSVPGPNRVLSSCSCLCVGHFFLNSVCMSSYRALFRHRVATASGQKTLYFLRLLLDERLGDCRLPLLQRQQFHVSHLSTRCFISYTSRSQRKNRV